MFALEANLGPVREQMYYLSRSKFVRCSYFLEVAAIEYNIGQLEPWYIEASAYVE